VNLTRWSTVASVVTVAGVAGSVSYLHAHDLVAAHGETGALAWLYPLTVDGPIYAASMTLLDAAKHDRPAPKLAYWTLGLGIAVTVAVNVLSGLSSGGLGSAISAWPAVALVLSYELLMVLIRAQAKTVKTAPASVPEDALEPLPEVHSEPVSVSVPEDAPEPPSEDTSEDTPEPLRRAPRKPVKGTRKGSTKSTPEDVYSALLASGELPSIRAIKRDLHVGDDKAKTIREDLKADLKPRLEVVG
jgi:uncharacterized protein DUF2637